MRRWEIVFIRPILRSVFSFKWGIMPLKGHLRFYIIAFCSPLKRLCAFLHFRWKSGFRTSAPSTKRSWSTAADRRGSFSTAPTPSPPARPDCPNFGRFPWRTKEPRCTQTITWTVLVTGTQTTTLTRTRCPGRRWCERSVSELSELDGFSSGRTSMCVY